MGVGGQDHEVSQAHELFDKHAGILRRPGGDEEGGGPGPVVLESFGDSGSVLHVESAGQVDDQGALSTVDGRGDGVTHGRVPEALGVQRGPGHVVPGVPHQLVPFCPVRLGRLGVGKGREESQSGFGQLVETIPTQTPGPLHVPPGRVASDHRDSVGLRELHDGTVVRLVIGPRPHRLEEVVLGDEVRQVFVKDVLDVLLHHLHGEDDGPSRFPIRSRAGVPRGGFARGSGACPAIGHKGSSQEFLLEAVSDPIRMFLAEEDGFHTVGFSDHFVEGRRRSVRSEDVEVHPFFQRDRRRGGTPVVGRGGGCSAGVGAGGPAPEKAQRACA